ncbi:hypothetical protein PPYR_02961 [Photinus pyralis]|uniref:Peptidase S1 domain-containing protein n=1 Tax=Photinus pyralis TaxID=7054 RepID=A0A5N4A1J1_PHOPY|nr:vitellin-degrading protease-like [Photinus pyralis]KAB0791161.1 hypothetical protein PPYR_02961 [Photinus pyralis]
MLRLVLVIAIAKAAVLPDSDGRIVGGYDTTIEARPYQLSLQNYGTHSCGASIIKATKAVTAAHCTNGQYAQAFSVRAGTSYRGYGGQVIPVQSVCEHSNYNPTLIDNDVAVLSLSYPIEFNARAQPIPLQPLYQEVPVGAYGIVTGWGAMYEGGTSSNSLKEVKLIHLSDATCTSAYGARKFTSHMICFGYPQGGRDSCQGDSGGPLAYNNALSGIVSWGYGCARPRLPGVYTKISDVSIRSHIDRCMA